MPVNGYMISRGGFWKNISIAMFGRQCRSSTQISKATVEAWTKSDDKVLLLRLMRGQEPPSSVQRYLDSSVGAAKITLAINAGIAQPGMPSRMYRCRISFWAICPVGRRTSCEISPADLHQQRSFGS